VLDTGLTLLAEVRANGEGEVDVTVFAAANEADGSCAPHLSAEPNAAAAEDTVLIAERIADPANAAAHCDVLYRAGIRGVGDEKLRDTTAELPDLLGIGSHDHVIANQQRARGRDLRAAPFDQLDDAEPARAEVGESGEMTEVRDTDPVFNGDVEYTRALHRVDLGSVYRQSYVLLHTCLAT